jgi:hypothetical protein
MKWNEITEEINYGNEVMNKAIDIAIKKSRCRLPDTIASDILFNAGELTEENLHNKDVRKKLSYLTKLVSERIK